MPADRFFVDAGVILCTYDSTDPVKREKAEAWLRRLWDTASGALSWQVLQEFYWSAVRQLGVNPDRAQLAVTLLSEWNPPAVTLGMLERAWFWTAEAQLPFWDAMIVAAAERARCRYLLSVDFEAGRQFGALTVLDPFTVDP